MRLIKNAVLGILVFGSVISMPAASFADAGHNEAFMKLLSDSAAALQASRPDLSTALSAFVTEEKNEKEEKKEKEGKEENEMKGHREAHLQLLRDSAAALKATRPDLAAALTKKADHNEKKMKEHKEGKENGGEMEEKEGK